MHIRVLLIRAIRKTNFYSSHENEFDCKKINDMKIGAKQIYFQFKPAWIFEEHVTFSYSQRSLNIEPTVYTCATLSKNI